MQLLNEKEAAIFLGCSISKLQRDRVVGSPIKFRKIGRNVKYALSDLQAYVEQQTFTSTAQYGGNDDR